MKKGDLETLLPFPFVEPCTVEPIVPSEILSLKYCQPKQEELGKRLLDLK